MQFRFLKTKDRPLWQTVLCCQWTLLCDWLSADILYQIVLSLAISADREPSPIVSKLQNFDTLPVVIGEKKKENINPNSVLEVPNLQFLCTDIITYSSA